MQNIIQHYFKVLMGAACPSSRTPPRSRPFRYRPFVFAPNSKYRLGPSQQEESHYVGWKAC